MSHCSQILSKETGTYLLAIDGSNLGFVKLKQGGDDE